jgi:hypothetical protein
MVMAAVLLLVVVVVAVVLLVVVVAVGAGLAPALTWIGQPYFVGNVLVGHGGYRATARVMVGYIIGRPQGSPLRCQIPCTLLIRKNL